jgi:hypothetical protein
MRSVNAVVLVLLPAAALDAAVAVMYTTWFGVVVSICDTTLA